MPSITIQSKQFPQLRPVTFEYDESLTGDVTLKREIAGVKETAVNQFSHLVAIVQMTILDENWAQKEKEMYFSTGMNSKSVIVLNSEIAEFVATVLREQAILAAQERLEYLLKASDNDILSLSQESSVLELLATGDPSLINQ